MKGTNLDTVHAVSIFLDENSSDIGLRFEDGEIFGLSAQLAVELARGLADAVLQD